MFSPFGGEPPFPPVWYLLVYYLILGCWKESGWDITAGFAGANVRTSNFPAKVTRIHVCKRCNATPKYERQAIEVKDHIFAFLEQSHISEKNVAHLERIAKLSSRKLPASPRLFWMSPALSRTKLEESTSLPRSIRNCWASCATPV